MARFDPKSYAKNVLRSAGYITAESIKGVNPTLTSYITETASSAREMYDFAKDFKRKSKEKIDEGGNGISTPIREDELKRENIQTSKTGLTAVNSISVDGTAVKNQYTCIIRQ